MAQIGERVCVARKRAGLDRKELAARLGLSYWAICKYEDGTRTPPSVVLGQIAKVTGTDANYLHGLTDDPRPSQVREPIAKYLVPVGQDLPPEDQADLEWFADYLRRKRDKPGPPSG